MRSGKRNYYLDLTRVVAVLAVVMLHTSAPFVTEYIPPAPEFLWGNIFDSMARLGVPLFIMISGALMLDENKDIKINTLFFKNIKNIVLLLLFWSAVYCVCYKVANPLITGKALSLRSIIGSFVMGHYHMWYLYMIIGLYLITPFLRTFVKKENKNLVLLFIAISLVSQFTIPVLNSLSLIVEDAAYLVQFINKFHLGFFDGYAAYYLAGWYLVHIGIEKKRLYFSLGMAALLITILYTQFTADYANAYSNQNIFIFLYSTSAFAMLNCKPRFNISTSRGRRICALSNLSFGVYIVHPLLQTMYGAMIDYTENAFLYILCEFGIVILLSFAGTYIASKLPVIKKAVRM